MIREHVVKCWPAYYDPIETGEKPFDVRLDDRGYQRDDILRLQRTCEHDLLTVERTYQGEVAREIRRRITWILTGGQFGIEPGYVVLGLAEVSAP